MYEGYKKFYRVFHIGFQDSIEMHTFLPLDDYLMMYEGFMLVFRDKPLFEMFDTAETTVLAIPLSRVVKVKVVNYSYAEAKRMGALKDNIINTED